VRPPKVGRKASSRDSGQDVTLDAVSRTVLKFVKKGMTDGRPVYQADIGAMLSNAFGANPPVYVAFLEVFLIFLLNLNWSMLSATQRPHQFYATGLRR
jgi:hypothetical protein